VGWTHPSLSQIQLSHKLFPAFGQIGQRRRSRVLNGIMNQRFFVVFARSSVARIRESLSISRQTASST
jgi:hypothetical protein